MIKKQFIAISLFMFGLFLCGMHFHTQDVEYVEAESIPPNLQSSTYQTLYAYVEDGEALDIVFNKITDHPTTTLDFLITVTGPGDVIYSPDGATTTGASCPFQASGSECMWTNLSTTTSGIWEIRYESDPPDLPGSDESEATYVWDITASDGGTPIDGRVYSEQLSLRQPGIRTFPLWYKGPSGFLYGVRQIDYNGFNSFVRGDSVGVRENGTCISGYRNAGSWNDADYSLAELGECGDPFKIFVNEPDPGLPATSTLPDGSTTWLAQEPVIPAVANLVFTGDSISQRSGDITFDISDHVGQFIAQVDTDNDGVFDGPNDVELDGFASSTSATIHFDGLDGNSDPVPIDQDIGVRVLLLRAGELHFAARDVEFRFGGIEAQALNGPDSGNYLNLFWNDSFDPDAATRCANSGGGDFSETGQPSEDGVHTWGDDTTDCTETWGNSKVVDDWTFASIDVEETVAVAGLDSTIQYQKTVDPIVTEVPPAQVFTYTVTVENTLDFPVTGVSFVDDLTDVVDAATYNGDATSTIGVVTFNAPDEIAWSGDLGATETATITYSVTMNDPETGDGDLENGIVGTAADANCTEDPAVDPACLTVVPLPVVESEKTLVSPSDPEVNDVVNYQFTITNTGDAAITTVVAADDLTGVLDDAVYNNDATSTAGALSYNTGTERLSWNGDLAASGDPGDSVIVTFSVTVNDEDALGDGVLENALLAPDCPSTPIFDSGDPDFNPDCVAVQTIDTSDPPPSDDDDDEDQGAEDTTTSGRPPVWPPEDPEDDEPSEPDDPVPSVPSDPTSGIESSGASLGDDVPQTGKSPDFNSLLFMLGVMCISLSMAYWTFPSVSKYLEEVR